MTDLNELPGEGISLGRFASEVEAKAAAALYETVEAVKNTPREEPVASAEPYGITLTRSQLEAWAARPLTDEHIDRLSEAIPNSSIPESISLISDQFAPLPEEDEGTTYRITVQRVMSCEVVAQGLTPRDALDSVKQQDFPLPAVEETTLVGWQFVVHDEVGCCELYRED